MNGAFLFRRPGQTQIVGAMIIMGILITAIAAAYSWGIPLLEKNRDSSAIRRSLQDINSLEEIISSVAQQGGSQAIEFEGNGEFWVDPIREEIGYRVFTRAAYVLVDNSKGAEAVGIPINEDEMNGIFGTPQEDSYGIRGVDKPGVIMAHANVIGDKFVTFFIMRFRELEDLNSNNGFGIDIVTPGDQELRTSNKKFRVVVRLQDREATNGVAGSKLGGDLTTAKLEVTIA